MIGQGDGRQRGKSLGTIFSLAALGSQESGYLIQTDNSCCEL